MGLDIYLTKYPSDASVIATNTKRVRDFYSNLRDEFDYEAAAAKTKAQFPELSIDQWGDLDVEGDRVNKPHPEFPDHICQIGYFRSSYNNSGMSGILRNMGIDDLEGIFKPDDTNYAVVVPYWSMCLTRCNRAIEELQDFISTNGNVIIAEERWNSFIAPTDMVQSPAAALQLYAENKAEHAERVASNPGSGFASYSRHANTFCFGEPMKVRAMFPSYTTSIMSDGMVPVMHLLVEYGVGEGLDYVLNGLMIVRDTIKHVMDDDNPECFALTWSG